MRLKIAGSHRAFFQKQGYIELESLLKPEEVALLATEIDEVLEKRLSDQLSYKSAEDLYRVGHDVWRESEPLRKKILSRSFAEVGAELFKKTSLHIAFDQILRTGVKPSFPQKLPSTLNEITSIYPLAGALLFRLLKTATSSEFIPALPENGIYLSPDKIIPWELFFQFPHQSYLLIAYANPESVYILQKQDPHTHALKKMGYVFGDRLKNETHPLLCTSR